MTDPLRRISTRSTPQTEPIPGRTDQVRNAAGGYVFQVDDWRRLRRFLVLGTEGGTYYTSEQKLTAENAQTVLGLIEHDGQRVVRELLDVSLRNLAPRQQPTLFVLAACTAASDPGVRRFALDVLRQLCRTGYHLFTFANYVEQFRGWGRGLRDAVAEWYTGQARDRLALQAVKYRQRDGWTHRDLLRLAHPKTDDPVRDAIFKWITHREDITWENGGSKLPNVIAGFELVQRVTDPKRVAQAVLDHDLPWECLPDATLRSPEVLEALVPTMGLTALTRQLGRMASTGALTSGSQLEKLVLERLRVPTASDERHIGEFLSRNANPFVQSKVHPFQLLLAESTYQAGRGVRGSLTWKPTSRIVDALDAGFYAAFGSLQPSDRTTLVALDVSGSMDFSTILNTHITPRVASAAMALITLRSEPDAHVMAFSDTLVPVSISPRQRLDDVVRTISNIPMGGTDCSLPMHYALGRKLHVDTFVVYTDNETWAGREHPTQALRHYREKINPSARLVVVGLTATDFTIADPKDPGTLDVVGFDASAPQVIADFSAGRL